MNPVSSYRLLLVEDNPGDAELTATRLAELPGYELDLMHVTDLRQASAALERERFDAVILDLTLPDSTGSETLHRLRAVRDNVDYIVLSGSGAVSTYYDVVITDLSMPGMSGFDLAREIRTVRPDMPIIMASGYVRTEDEQAAQALGVRGIFLKPNTVEELGHVLDRLFTEIKSDGTHGS